MESPCDTWSLRILEKPRITGSGRRCGHTLQFTIFRVFRDEREDLFYVRPVYFGNVSETDFIGDFTHFIKSSKKGRFHIADMKATFVFSDVSLTLPNGVELHKEDFIETDIGEYVESINSR